MNAGPNIRSVKVGNEGICHFTIEKFVSAILNWVILGTMTMSDKNGR
jgi:hypothetical protein